MIPSSKPLLERGVASDLRPADAGTVYSRKAEGNLGRLSMFFSQLLMILLDLNDGSYYIWAQT